MTLKFGFAYQLTPVVRRMTALEHFAKGAIRIIAAFVSSLSVNIINPGVDDHLRCSVITKEQTVLLKKFRTKPVFPVTAQRTPLSVFRAGRVLRDDIKSQTGNSG